MSLWFVDMNQRRKKLACSGCSFAVISAYAIGNFPENAQAARPPRSPPKLDHK
jgi:hypothetical protein